MFWNQITSRWNAECGYREILRISLPLTLSTGSWSLQQFVDRMFLTWYSPEAIAASMPAGMVNWTIVSLFMGTAVYVNTFVAQYYGAGRYQRIGPSVWQGIYLSVVSLLVVFIIYPFIEPFFGFVGHPLEVQQQEIEYFRVLMFGAPFVVISNAVSSFFSGRGRTVVVMWVNFISTAINIVLDYLFIFGKLGFPEMGIGGAGLATVISAIMAAAMFMLLAFRSSFNKKYHTLQGWRFNMDLFRRLIRFGLPNGLQFLLEMLAFTIFILLIGKIGVSELAATNIAFNINSLAFMPMYGFTIAVSILVGQRLGENRPDKAERSTWSAFHISFAYFGGLAVAYLFLPGIFILPFALQASGQDFAVIRKIIIVLLRFVAVYSLFDALNMVFSAAVKGAGDTRFVATTSVGLSWLLMLIPSYISLNFLGGGLYWLWVFVTLYIICLGLVFFYRFSKGAWKKMRVIEHPEDEATE